MDVRNITKIVRNMMLYKNMQNREKTFLNDTEFEMVRYLTKRKDLSLIELANYLNVDKALVTRMSKKLVSLGYIEIKDNQYDARKKVLNATQKVTFIKEQIAKEEIDFYNACLKVLTESEQKNFEILIEKVYLESKRLRKTGFEDVKK